MSQVRGARHLMVRWVMPTQTPISTIDKNRKEMPMKTGEKGASQAVFNESPIPLIPGMNIYEECWTLPETGPHQAPSTTHLIAEALRQKYRLTTCACGGTRVHSKTSGWSTCLQCQVREEVQIPLAARTRQRCKRCKVFRWAVLKANYCDRCYERVQKAKAHIS